MERHIALCALITLGAGGCCFGGTGSLGVTGPVTSIGPGFAPDPMVLPGVAGGATPASSLDPRCVGHVGLLPSHTLQISAPMPVLRVMAHSEQDTTLVVRRPDGSYVCNDDADGLDPSVDLVGVQPGAYTVYVGTYAAGASAQYRLGLTTQLAITPSSMLAPPVTPTAPVPPVPSGASGTVLRSGTLTVAFVSGNVPGIAPGTTCSYTQTSIDPAQHDGWDCRWRVVCGGAVVYGDGEGGFNRCQDPSWPPGTLVADTGTTAEDGDPSIVFDSRGFVLRDDAQGASGEHQITALVVPALPQPVPPPPG